ncbi:MAG TPA: tetratricopeptide repeat protein [Pyrinomonadaceae bacterium]
MDHIAAELNHMTLPLPIVSIFVSSTWEDLQPERRAVIEALNRLRQLKFVGMEYSGAWSEPPIVPSLKEARECHAYVGIFGGRYGSGITEQEYRAARTERKKCFIYFKNNSFSPAEVDREPEKRGLLQALKNELLDHHTCEPFTFPEDLASKVSADLSNWYARDFFPQWAEDVGKRVRGYAPFQLERPPGDFVGRQQEIALIKKALAPSANAKIAGVSGMGGVGKTALALFVADELRADYPHAQLYVQLKSMRNEPLDLAEALTRCLESLGEKRQELPDNIDGLSIQYRNCLSGKRALVVLDDVASEAQVRAFLPPPECALIVTSHKRLAVPGITQIPLKPLDVPDASKLLTLIAKRGTVDEIEQIVNLCGRLPIAVRAAGSLLDVEMDIEPGHYVDQLRKEQARLEELDRAGSLEIGVEATFNISYRRLNEEAQRIFRNLSIFPATFDRKADEVVCADNSGTQLSDLTRLSLVVYDEKTSRYHLHDLVRIYAAQLLQQHERSSGLRRHALHYLDVAQNLAALYEHEDNSGLELFDMEWMNLQAARIWTTEHYVADAEAAHTGMRYVDALKQLLHLRRSPQEQIKWMDLAVAASRQLGQRLKEGRYLCDLGTAYSLKQPQEAITHFQQAIEIAVESKDLVGKGNALGGLGNAYASIGEDAMAIQCYEQCLHLLSELSDQRGSARTLTHLGNIYAGRGESRVAIEFYEQALEIARFIGDRRGEATALCNLGEEKVNFEENVAAIDAYQKALLLMNETDDLRGQATALTGIGNAYSGLNNHAEALEYYRKALQISQEVGDSRGEGMALGSIGNEYATMGQLDQASHHHQQALSISRQSGDRRSEVQDLINLGHVQYLSNAIKEARAFHFEALEISREIDAPLYEARALWNIAQTFDKSNDTESAIHYADAAFEIFDHCSHPLAEAARQFINSKRSATTDH